MTVVGYLRERPAPALPEVTENRVTTATVSDLIRRAARVPWCSAGTADPGPRLHRVGRPELWRDELSSWSFAARPLSGLIATARHTGATQLAYYLLLHFWITAFGGFRRRPAQPVGARHGRRRGVRHGGRPQAGGPRAASAPGLVFALVPSVSRFAQEAVSTRSRSWSPRWPRCSCCGRLDRPSGDGGWPTPRAWRCSATSTSSRCRFVAGHAAGSRYAGSTTATAGQLWFAAAAAAGLAACAAARRARLRPGRRPGGMDTEAGARPDRILLLLRNLFYSASVADALIVLAVPGLGGRPAAGRVRERRRVLPVAVMWLVSQGPLSYLFPGTCCSPSGPGPSWPGSRCAGSTCGSRWRPARRRPSSARAISR